MPGLGRLMPTMPVDNLRYGTNKTTFNLETYNESTGDLAYYMFNNSCNPSLYHG